MVKEIDPKLQQDKAPEPGGAARNHRGEVRAGPGDAGAADKPTVLPPEPDAERRQRSRHTLYIVLAVLSVLIIGFLLIF